MLKKIAEGTIFWLSVTVPAILVCAAMIVGLGVYDIAYQDGCSTSAAFVRFIIGLF